MQIITAFLKVAGSKGIWSTLYDRKTASPEIVVGVAATLRFDLRQDQKDEELILMPYPAEELNCSSYYLALDVDFLHTTTPRLLISSDITLHSGQAGETFLDVTLPNTATPDILSALEAKKTLTLNGEIGGFAGEKCVFAIGFDVTLRNRVWLGNDVPPEIISDPEYLTAAQVKALIAEATRSETPGPAGTTPHIGENGNWFIGTADTGIRAAGKDGKDGTDAEDGEDGKNAYQLAVDNGYTGTVTEWLADLKGEPGTGLHIDATGYPAELHAYDDEKAGFVFAASEVDSKARTCTKYFYVKKSDDSGDWFDPPLTEVTYERTAEVATLEAVEFSAPGRTAEYLQLDLSSFPNSWLAAVTIETNEGELQLSLNSNSGLRKIVRKDGNLRIYFGSTVPEFEKGKLYLTQFVGLVNSSSPETPDPGIITDKSIYYGYVTMSDAGVISNVKELNQGLINSALESGTVFHVPLMINTQYTLNVPANSWVVALVPAGVHACKDNGIGAKTAFTEMNGQQHTGANGTCTITLETGVFEVYGEFQFVTGQTTIYVDFQKSEE